MIDSNVYNSAEKGTRTIKTLGSRLLPYLPIFVISLCAVLCLVIGFSQKPQVYPVDYGQYERILKDIGLEWTEEDISRGNLQFERPITTFAYKHFSWSNLLTPNAGHSLVYLAAIVRLLSEPFGLYLSVDHLSLISACLLVISVVLMAVGLRRIIPRCWFVPEIVICAAFTNGNFCAMFRGLYPEGFAILFTLFFAGVLFYTWGLPSDKRTYYVPALVISSFLMVKASTPLIVFLPFVIVLDLVFIINLIRIPKRSYFIPFVSLLLMVTGCSSSIQLAKSDLDYFSNASIYESVFYTLMPASDEPEIIAIELGLDKSYLDDIGKSYYLDSDVYTHDPRDPEEAAVLFSKVKSSDVIWSYLLHPELLEKVLQNIPVITNRFFENPRYREKDMDNNQYAFSRSDGGGIAVIWQFFPHSYRSFIIFQCILLLCFVVAAILLKKHNFFLLSLFLLCGIFYLPFCVILNGYNLSQQYILYQSFIELMLIIISLTGLISLVPYVELWITKYMNDPYQLSPVGVFKPGKVLFFEKNFKFTIKLLNHLAGNRLSLVLFTLLFGGSMLLFVCLPSDHPASVNNGDFGRVINQLDIMWPGDVYFDIEAQMGHGVIEEYNYVKPFDPLKLTPLKPTYTVYWFASIVRLLTEPFGRQFSTLIMAWVMEIISLICVVKIVWDLYPLLKRWTFAAAFILCVLLFSETTLAWYNSLFGEATILIGLLLSLMCAVHLCLIPQRGKNSLLWLIGLAVSLYIFVGAKSQMLVTVPGAVLLFAVLAFYHRPYRYDLMALYILLMLGICGMLAYSGFGVYRSERSSDSVSQKSNMWHAYFYGIFMISDDPIADMEELGVDTAMAPDIGKFVQFEDDSQYVYAPLSDEADKAFHQHVSLMTIMRWYLSHPAKLWYMLDYAAKTTQSLYTDFRVYKGQDYGDPSHDPVDGMNMWPGWRIYWTPSGFLGYVILYGVILLLCIRMLIKKRVPANKKILYCIPLFMLITAAIQFPISVLGNGFGDNQKQMFGFELCHDLIMSGVLVLGARYLYHHKTIPFGYIRGRFSTQKGIAK